MKNPRPGQQDRGVVFGATCSALVKIRAKDGEKVRCLSKNLVLIERADERERTERSRAGITTITTERQSL